MATKRATKFGKKVKDLRAKRPSPKMEKSVKGGRENTPPPRESHCSGY